MTRRILVCGGRDFADYDAVGRFLDMARAKYWDLVIIHGAARGADSLAGYWAKANHIPVEEYPADWKQHGKGAGSIRNQRMLDEGRPDAVLAFPGGVGTADMIRRARAAGLPVWEPLANREEPPHA